MAYQWSEHGGEKQWTNAKAMNLKLGRGGEQSGGCRGIFLFTRRKIRYAFAKLTSFLLGALKVILGDVVSGESFLAAFLSVMR